MADTLTIDFSKPIPLFPLPNCALLPHATIPLHVFEPRYRKMVADALDSRGLIAMAVFDGDNWKESYQGKPPIRRHVCVGYIIRHERLEDGRYNLLLQGVCRAQIVEEEEHDPYRVALLQPIETQATLEIDLGEHRREIDRLLNEPAMKQLAAINAIHNWLNPDIPTAVVVDLAIITLVDDVEQRYPMLAEPDPEARAAWLENLLRKTLHTVQIASRYGSGQTEDGWNLN